MIGVRHLDSEALGLEIGKDELAALEAEVVDGSTLSSREAGMCSAMEHEGVSVEGQAWRVQAFRNWQAEKI